MNGTAAATLTAMAVATVALVVVGSPQGNPEPAASARRPAAAASEVVTPSGMTTPRARTPSPPSPADEAAPPSPAPPVEHAQGPLPPVDVGPAPARPLESRALALPVRGVSAAALVPGFDQQRGDRPHEALDIMAPTGTPVVAIDDGHVEKLFTSKAGGLTIYHFDPEQQFAYYYAHLDRYAAGLTEGQRVTRGEVIGFVGSTGNASADAPHLHFAIFRLGPDRRWWQGVAIDPYPLLRPLDGR